MSRDTRAPGQAGADPIQQVMAIVTEGFRGITDMLADHGRRFEDMDGQIGELRAQQSAQRQQMHRMVDVMSVPQKAAYAHRRVMDDGMTRKAVAQEMGKSPSRVGQLVKQYDARVNPGGK
ncbi:hypothetical protein AB4Y45_33650 [Paraburkholderia sp. EG287A]|uniref:hypothetical protein n=1 Tax=Paraburkholderia sp. EG287A TaxID=3237012 RepID=UPI0034D3571A